MEATVGTLEPAAAHGWRRGLSNLIAAGFRGWWRTSTWWIQALIWGGLTAIPTAAVLLNEGDSGEAPPLTIFVIMAMIAFVAVAIIMQDEIVGERKAGTAEWVLSKPVSRAAFVVAKLISNGVGMLVTMVLVPSVIAYLLNSIVLEPPDPVGFAAGMGVIGLHLLFYLTLTLMLGTLLPSAGAVIGIALAFGFGQQWLVSLPVIGEMLPWSLVVPPDGAAVSDASALMLGQPMPAPLAIPAVAVACVVFVAVAIRSFERAEF